MTFASHAKSAVVMPVHNGRELTARALAALELAAGDFMVVLVDDGSSDGTSACVRSSHPSVRIVEGDGNLWWSGAVDKGCRFAISEGAEALILLNNDNVACSSNLVEEIAAVAAETGGCAGATVLEELEDGSRRILQAGGCLQWWSGRTPLRKYGAPYEESLSREECDWLPGAALGFSSLLFLELGGIDFERFPQYRGDIDFTLRARKSGRTCTVLGDAWVVNDRTQIGMVDYRRRLSYRDFGRSFVSLRSNYNLREAVPFALRHSPRLALVPFLILYYARHTWGFLRSRRRAGRRRFVS